MIGCRFGKNSGEFLSGELEEVEIEVEIEIEVEVEVD